MNKWLSFNQSINQSKVLCHVRRLNEIARCVRDMITPSSKLNKPNILCVEFWKPNYAFIIRQISTIMRAKIGKDYLKVTISINYVVCINRRIRLSYYDCNDFWEKWQIVDNNFYQSWTISGSHLFLSIMKRRHILQSMIPISNAQWWMVLYLVSFVSIVSLVLYILHKCVKYFSFTERPSETTFCGFYL